MSFDRNAMRGPGGEARTPWAEDVLLKGALERVRKAEGDLEAALSEEQAARRLVSVRKDLETQLTEQHLESEKLSEKLTEALRERDAARSEAAQLRYRVADALRFLASGDRAAACRCLAPTGWIVL